MNISKIPETGQNPEIPFARRFEKFKGDARRRASPPFLFYFFELVYTLMSYQISASDGFSADAPPL